MSAAVTLLFESGSRGAEPAPWQPDPQDRAKDEQFIAHARILVVDDESIVRSVVSRLLENAGHSVMAALNGAEALRIMESDTMGFDLVVTDIRMPGLDGWELGQRVNALYPGMPILYMSGYDLDRGTRELPLLRKPFEAEELLSRVRSLLGSG